MAAWSRSVADADTARLMQLITHQEDLAALPGILRVTVVPPGRSLYTQGEACKGAYWLLSGIVGLRRSDAQGNSAMLRLVRAGDVLGYRALLENCSYYNTAEALTSCRVLFVPATRLNSLIERNALLRQRFLQMALREIADVEAKCAALLTEGLKSRFLQLVMMFYEEAGAERGERVFDLPLQRKDIAALLGATPESISRLINRLGGEGRLVFEGRRVVVPCMDRLTAVH